LTIAGAPPINLAQVAAEVGQPSAGFNMDRLDARMLAKVSTASGSPYSMTSFLGRTCSNITLNIGFDGSFSYGFQQQTSVYGFLTPNFIGGIQVYTLSKLAVNQFQLTLYGTWAANTVYALMLRNSTAAISGTFPDLILLNSAASFSTGVDAFGNAISTWAWGAGAAAALTNWPALVGNNVQVQAIL